MKPHRTDPVSLLAGLACLGVATLWLAAYLVPLSIATVAATCAIGVLVLVAVGLVYAIIGR